MTRKTKLAIVTTLTFVRFPLVVLFFIGAIAHSIAPRSWLFCLTFAALVTSAVTDMFDGYYARKFDVETPLGAHADPLMDKLFYLTTLPLLVFVTARDGQLVHAVILLVLTMLFLSRDQWVTFLRSIGSMYNVSGSANWSGKLRTGVNFPLICTVYYFEEAPASILFFDHRLVYVFEIFAFTLNFVSLYIYTRHYWPYLKKAIALKKNLGNTGH